MSDGLGKEPFRIFPIGYVRRKGKGVSLEILEPFRPALKQLGHSSHVTVFWWRARRGCFVTALTYNSAIHMSIE